MSKITKSHVEEYVSSLDGGTTFLPELIEVIGTENFLKLVTLLGGQKVVIPTPEKVHKDIQALIKNGEENGR